MAAGSLSRCQCAETGYAWRQLVTAGVADSLALFGVGLDLGGWAAAVTAAQMQLGAGSRSGSVST
jgi:hypothetical protein